MSLALVYRIGAVYIALWVLLMLFAPDMVAAETFGTELTLSLRAIMQAMALCMITIAIIHWTLPTWATDSAHRYGVLFAFIWAAFAILNLVHMSVGMEVASVQNYISAGIMGIIAILFYIKSSA
ncbi:MAG: hypothetical protein QGG88_08935 [Gammaproteobacteria bacterium]|nr:hypothetical protein [Gammaproteobacteria bacterium]